MISYTVVFYPSDDNAPACVHIDAPEFVHLNTLEMRYVHLMFFGHLANAWGYGWDEMRFAPQTDLFSTHGTIEVKDKPLHYDIVVGHYTPADQAALLTPPPTFCGPLNSACQHNASAT